MTNYPPSISEYYKDKWENEGEKKMRLKAKLKVKLELSKIISSKNFD